jgi:DNA-directed RNA polymerase beta subunit
VELIDKEEEETCNIVGFPSELETLPLDVAKRYTHCEIHPSLIYGVSGSIIPFSNHNQCIFQEEVVYMEDGSKKKIKDVVEGDRVTNFDPKTGALGSATVVAVTATKTNKQMYELVLATGQSLTATFDHRIITPKGWKRVDCLSEGDFVGVHPARPPLSYITFVPIASKMPVDTKLISDITTDSPNQSFICGDGFGVHNSPRNCYQCIWKEEPVLMGDGTWRPIKDVKIGDEVITFHPETMETSVTKVINHFVRSTKKKIVEVTTVSGRKIVVTADHKIMTESGWVEARNLEGCMAALAYTGQDQIFYRAQRSHLPSCYFQKILSVIEKPNVEIADITTESENHSFIAGQGFCVHNSSMGKQAVGVPFSNYREIMCGSFHTLMYLQKPLCLTRAGSIVRFHEMPAGQNAIVAIMPRPFNEEDSIEMNADSIDRGFMVSFKWTCFYAEVKEENSEIFGIPEEKNTEKFRGNPRHLLPQGFPKPGSKIENGDIVIGKLICNGDGGDPAVGAVRPRKRYTNASQMYDHVWPAVVDKIMHGTTGDGYRFIRVMLCQRREPIVGDKFSFMHGQKGTIGMIMRSIDLPFNSQGISPDIVVNSLALPSRMTIAMMIEDWTGKAITSTSRLHNITVNEVLNYNDGKDEEVSKSKIKLKSGPSKEFKDMFCRSEHPAERPAMIDSTPFRKFDRNVIAEEMKKYGLQYGDEFLTDGVTGKRLRSLVFFGPAYSQRLKHMVVDKIHSRAKGGKTTLMRQPLEGRAMGGGLRFGVMERDCMLGQGSSKFVRDRLFICSDDYRAWYCDICGLIVGNPDDGCRVCGQNKLSKIRIPYGTKLVDQELMAMNIVPRILTAPRDKE